MRQGSAAPAGAAAVPDIVVGDIVRWLASQADVQCDARTGNAAFAEVIRTLADTLKPYRARPVPDLLEMLAALETPKVPKPQRKPPVELPADLATLTKSTVEQVLDDERYVKNQLADLGFQRFGIPRSRLCRLTKADAVAAIRAALDHERSLEAIGQQARIAAERRSRAA